MLDFIADHILLRGGLYNDSGCPRLTTGTIILGALLRTFAIMLIGFVLWRYAGVEYSLPISLALLWGYAVYPAYRQFVLFSNISQALEKEILCSRCRHYNRSGQYCQLYDEHVRADYVPCGGDDWEPSE